MKGWGIHPPEATLQCGLEFLAIKGGKDEMRAKRGARVLSASELPSARSERLKSLRRSCFKASKTK